MYHIKGALSSNSLKRSICLFILFVVSLSAFTQNVGQDPTIQVIARVQNEKILLRWAPTSPSAWMKANTYGYQIERYTVSRNGILVSPPEKKILTSAPLIPEPLEEWQTLAENNDYAAILAQALFGENFEVEGMEDEGAMAQIINKSKEAEQRFSFALFAADMNFEGAKMAALGYEDRSISDNEEYLYRISAVVPENLLKIHSGSVVVKSLQPEPLPAPIDLIAIPDDKTILLTWEYEMFKSLFTTYYVEKSENGIDFTQLEDIPLVNLSRTSESERQRMQYVDTLSVNNKKYYYRVKGISPFGEESLPSEVVSAEGIKKLTAIPHIVNYTLEDINTVLIEWEFPKAVEGNILRFELNWSMNKKGPYTIVDKDLLPNSRKTRYQKLAPSNYFTITAIGKNNQKKESLSAFVQTIDETPPTPPIGFEGTIDSLGIVTLQWQPNMEKDILGYRIFRGNLANEEVSQITIAPIEKAVFRDTVQIKSLNNEVFYQVVAVDRRFNMSDYSEKIKLEKPDVIPPSSPTFVDYKINTNGVYLEWIRSSSTDVESHQLYRQNTEESEKGWELLLTTKTETSFTDTTLKSNTKYRYAIFAKDNTGLISEASTPVTLVFKNTVPDMIKGFSVIADRTNNKINLNWRNTSKDIAEILIYKSKKEEDPVLWKQVLGSINKIEDRSVSPNNIYVYHLKAITTNGSHSTIKTKEIEF